MRNGFTHNLPNDISISSRRCYGESDDQVIEFTVESFPEGGWFQSHVCLTPDQAIDIAKGLLAEAHSPLTKEAHHP